MPDFATETDLIAQGFRRIAGVDEAGRGPLAGPVVAAAAMLDPKRIPDGLDDSKALSERRRNALFAEIVRTTQFCVVSAPPHIIEARNIRGATLWAMRQAVLGLPVPADHVLVDGRDIPPGLPCAAEALIGGDGRSVSIAAASIIAKVTRDRMCVQIDRDAPGYGIARHKGYGSAAHLDALHRLGPSPHHRRDFAPVRAVQDLAQSKPQP
ncbi:MAG: ribonuclease HII [Hyphomicrobiaceae bacterium]|nr:ribonuclease HII [Hyphomicrobiaceae bacterium]MCC0023055.1 ribonuclease HII [Hyphomicrobiaceae bacterium]